VRSAVLLAFEIEARNAAKDLQPQCRVAADLNLRLDWSERVEGLVEQVAHHAGLGCLTCGADVMDRQVVVHAHVALDEASHLPRLIWTIEMLQQEDVTAAGGPAVAFAMALIVWVREGGADGVTKRRGVTRLGRPDTVRQTFFSHAAPCVPTA
jgi:hypothetical protein